MESNTPAGRLKARAVPQSHHSSWYPARKDCCLNLSRASAPAQHPCEEIGKFVEAGPAGNIVRAFESPTGHQAKRSPARCRSVMKTRLQGNIAVVQTIRIQ